MPGPVAAPAAMITYSPMIRSIDASSRALIVRLTKGKRSEGRLRAANYWFGPKGLIGP